jgi:hypothetical protein
VYALHLTRDWAKSDQMEVHIEVLQQVVSKDDLFLVNIIEQDYEQILV